METNPQDLGGGGVRFRRPDGDILAWSVPTPHARLRVSLLEDMEVLEALQRWGRARRRSGLWRMGHGWTGLEREGFMVGVSGATPPGVPGHPNPILPQPLRQPTKASKPRATCDDLNLFAWKKPYQTCSV